MKDSTLAYRAERLVKQLDEVHADTRYRAVWELHQLHNGPYVGTRYDAELAELKAALQEWWDWENAK